MANPDRQRDEDPDPKSRRMEARIERAADRLAEARIETARCHDGLVQALRAGRRAGLSYPQLGRAANMSHVQVMRLLSGG